MSPRGRKPAKRGRARRADMKEMSLPVGTIIKNRRKMLGLSQMRLAEDIGVTYQMVQKYESGKSELTIARLRQIAEALDLPPQSLVNSETYEHEKSFVGLESRELKLLKLFKRLPSDAIKDGLITMIEDLTKLCRKEL